MHLFLVQHAEALPKQENLERPLTAEGRGNAAAVAAMCGKLGLAVHQIQHSGKTRAEQTARIVAEALSPPGGVVQVDGLGPRDEVEPVAARLIDNAEPVMLVGHLPFLERLAACLLTGDPERTIIQFTNAAIVCLVGEGDRWQVRWIITPEIAAL
jgi:phosphohistidine phosphatase